MYELKQMGYYVGKSPVERKRTLLAETVGWDGTFSHMLEMAKLETEKNRGAILK